MTLHYLMILFNPGFWFIWRSWAINSGSGLISGCICSTVLPTTIKSQKVEYSRIHNFSPDDREARRKWQMVKSTVSGANWTKTKTNIANKTIYASFDRRIYDPNLRWKTFLFECKVVKTLTRSQSWQTSKVRKELRKIWSYTMIKKKNKQK